MQTQDSIRTLARFFQTIRYLSPRQVLIRSRRIASRKWYRVVKKRAPQPTCFRIAAGESLQHGLAGLKESANLNRASRQAAKRAAAIRSLTFEFLNRKIQFKDKPGWHDQGLSHLWRYHLHYFDYCDDLLVDYFQCGNMANYEAFKALSTSWISANAFLYGDGWHPYTLSVRVVNWLNAVAGFSAPLANDPEFKARLISSLGGQLQVLSNDLEHDVRGNHLLKNLRALLIGSCALKGENVQRWHARALQLLHSEIQEQVLPDGGHFERNPGYHLAVLKDLLECALWIQRDRGKRYPWLDNGLRRMLDWLVIIALPENRLPLIKDTTRDFPQTIAEILAVGALYFDTAQYKLLDDFGAYPFLLFGKEGQARFKSWPRIKVTVGSTALRESGFFLMRDSAARDFLIFDAGKACPDYLPAHAHADMLSYELTIGGQPIVVDSGVYEYTAGRWRDFFRSTRAHNTVELGGRNQSDVWSSFRVADRARPGAVKWQDATDHVVARAGHNGYLKPPAGAAHLRTICWQKGHFWLVWDALSGDWTGTAENHIHLHPDVQLQRVDDALWRLEGGTNPLWLRAFGHDEYTVCSGRQEPLFQGWYSEKFGEKRPNTVLTLRKDAGDSEHFGYAISKSAPVTIDLHTAGANTGIMTILHEKKAFTYNLSQEAGVFG